MLICQAAEETSWRTWCLVTHALLLVQSITDFLSLSIPRFTQICTKETRRWFSLLCRIERVIYLPITQNRLHILPRLRVWNRLDKFGDVFVVPGS